MEENRKAIIRVENLVKSYEQGEITISVLKNINLTIHEGEFLAILGRSGAGKSTLLYHLSLLDMPDAGSLFIEDVPTHELSQEEIINFRLTRLGYVFQDYSLILELTALENVMIPLLMQGVPSSLAKERAIVSLDSVGLLSKIHNLPAKLSGGEQQRVSIARAINHKPKILFADEPTANLDAESSEVVMQIFEKLHREEGITIVMVTHEEDFGKRAERSIRLVGGAITS